MRTTILALITLLLAWGVWQIVGDHGPADVDGLGVEDESVSSDPRVAESEAAAYSPGALPTSGTLRIKVTSKSGHVPGEAKVGYIFGGRERLRAVDALGLAVFTDAPLGKLEVVGRAPGFLVGTRLCFLNAGVPVSVILRLELDEDSDVLIEPAVKR
jgi:hypothetical protein